MGLGAEISSAVFGPVSRNSSSSSGLWVAFGTQIALFDLSLSTLVLKLSDATRTFQVVPSLQDEDDVLNEVSLPERDDISDSVELDLSLADIARLRPCCFHSRLRRGRSHSP